MSKKKFYLTLAANTWNPALQTLEAKGYKVFLEDPNWYCAKKEHRRFNAHAPVELLGLVAMWEHFGDDWRAVHPRVDSWGKLHGRRKKKTK